jgi:hypothetical protein
VFISCRSMSCIMRSGSGLLMHARLFDHHQLSSSTPNLLDGQRRVGVHLLMGRRQCSPLVVQLRNGVR